MDKFEAPTPCSHTAQALHESCPGRDLLPQGSVSTTPACWQRTTDNTIHQNLSNKRKREQNTTTNCKRNRKQFSDNELVKRLGHHSKNPKAKRRKTTTNETGAGSRDNQQPTIITHPRRQTTITTFFKPRQEMATMQINNERPIVQAPSTQEIHYNNIINKEQQPPPCTSSKICSELIETPKVTKKEKLTPTDIIYTNQQHKKAALNTLSLNIKGNKAPIITICEPYFDKNLRIPNIHKDLTTLKPKYDTSLGGPRVAICIHKTHQQAYTQISEFDSRDSMAIMLNYKKQKIIIATIYMDRELQFPIYQEKIQHLAKLATIKKAGLIINSDTNAHNKIWGDKTNDKRGDELLITLTRNNLQIVNTGSNHTFENSRLHKSTIDLTIANTAGATSLSKWRVSNEFSNSDHKYIRAQLQIRTKNYTEMKRDSNTDWEKYKEILNKKITNIIEPSEATKMELDAYSNKINEAIISTWHASTKTTYISSTLKPPPWENEEIRKQKNITKKRLKKYRKEKTHETYIALQTANQTLNKLQRHHKTEAWKKFTKGIEKIRDIGRINKICKNFENTYRALDCVYDKNGTLTNNPIDTIKIMKETHFGPDIPTSLNQISFAPTNNELQFNTTDVRNAILSMKSNKSPGPDLITSNMLKQAIEIITRPLSKLFQLSYDIGQTPDNWKTSKGVFMPKPGKTDYHQPKSYRTITLAPVILKIQERLIYWSLERNNIDATLNKNQFGFRKSSSTEAALHKLVHKIEKRMKAKQFALGVFLDVEGAFDKISFESIQKGLIRKGLPPRTVNWIMNMTSTRSIIIGHKNKELSFRINKGVAQGGILSPLIWNIVLDDLLQASAKDAPAYLQAFADDMITLAVGSDLSIIHARTQKTLRHINDWCKSQGLSLSAIKTTMVMFTNKKNWTLKPILIDNTEIKLTNTVKFLGVTLDNKLKFNDHINEIITKAKRNLMRVNIAVGPTWGLTPTTTLWIYKQIIRPILTYAAPIWINATKTKLNQRKLRSLQRLALRIVSGAYPSTAGADLNILTNTQDIIHHIEKIATETIGRLKSTDKWTKDSITPAGTHAHTCNELWSKLNIPSDKLDKTKKDILSKNYDCIIDWEQGMNPQTSEDYIDVYTDGSKDENNNTGIGIFSNNSTASFEISENLSKHSTVFQAEIHAIKRAAEQLTTLGLNNRNVRIRSDSAAAIKALNKLTVDSNTVKECNEALNVLAQNNKIEIKWVKAHIGIEGNEKADQLAKEGCTNTETPNELPIPSCSVKSITKTNATNDTFKTFKSTGGKILTNIIEDKNSWAQLTKNLQPLYNNKKKFRFATFICTGIGPFNQFLHKIGRSPTPVCRLCGDAIESVEHIICKCEALALTRINLTGDPIFSSHKVTILNQIHTAIRILEKAEKSNNQL